MHDQNRAELKLVNQYIIPFKGLKEGDHEFEFGFDQKFFDEHKVLEAKSGNIGAIVFLTKKTNILSLSTTLKGDLNIQCDRCLEYFNYPIHSQSDLLVKFGENTGDSTDEIWVVDPNSHDLNMEQYLYECILLSLPIQRIHSDDANVDSGCNPEMLEKLEQLSSSEKKEDVDPRWNALKNLFNDTN